MKRTLLFLLVLLLSETSLAANRYVSDELIITMRTGAGTQHRIVKTLKTGDKVELLEEDQESGYALVRNEEGLEGWVLGRYLTNEKAARDRLVSAEQRVDKLNTTVKDLRAQLSEIKSNKSSLEKESGGLAKAKEKLEKELETIRRVSANQIAIHEENEELKSQLLNIRRKIQEVEQENIELKDGSARDWFLIGAGVCIAGILLGLVLPNLKFRRRQSWGSL